MRLPASPRPAAHLRRATAAVLLAAAGVCAPDAAAAAAEAPDGAIAPDGAPAERAPAAGRDLLDLPFEQLLQVKVVTASRYEQSAADLAAVPQVIDAERIRLLGYRTLAEILDGFTGTHVQSNGIYTRVGVRGFLRPGDFNARLLVLVDGQRVNDIAFDSAGLANDALVDVELIERVEFIPGPGSSLYGANAMFGVVNVITRNPAAAGSAPVAWATAASPRGGEAGAAVRLGGAASGASALLSASRRVDSGEVLGPEALGPALPPGTSAAGAGRDEVTRLFGKFAFGSTTRMTLAHVDREIGIYNGAFLSQPNVPGQRGRDALSFFGLADSRPVGERTELVARVGASRHRYETRLGYDVPQVGAIYQGDRIDASSVSADVRVLHRWSPRNTLVAGFEALRSTRLRWTSRQEGLAAPLLDLDDTLLRRAVYAQNDLRLSDRWSVSVGARVDRAGGGRVVVSPRLGVVLRPSASTAVKFQHGSAFRQPNSIERLYISDPTDFRINTDLNEERLVATDLFVDHAFSERFSGRAGLFRYGLRDLIDYRIDPAGGLIRQANIERATIRGAQVDLAYRDRSGAELSVGAAAQRATDADGDALLFAPQQTVKLRLISPPWQDMRAALEWRYVGRQAGRDGDLAGYGLTHLTVSRALGAAGLFGTRGATLSLSVRNLFDQRYRQPLAEEFRQASLPGSGRQVWLRLVVER